MYTGVCSGIFIYSWWTVLVLVRWYVLTWVTVLLHYNEGQFIILFYVFMVQVNQRAPPQTMMIPQLFSDTRKYP